MPRFQYRAVDAGDHVVEASIEADDRDTALTRLRGEGLLPLRLDLIGYAGGKFRLTQLRRWLSHFDPDAKRLLPAAITVFVRELSMLLDAGIGADRALLIIARSTEQSVLAQLATDLRQRVRTGDSLADALDQDPRHFDEGFRATVRAGEGGSARRARSEELQQPVPPSIPPTNGMAGRTRPLREKAAARGGRAPCRT